MYFFCYQKPRFQNNIIISVSPAVYLFSTSILIDVIQWWVGDELFYVSVGEQKKSRFANMWLTYLPSQLQFLTKVYWS